MSEDNSTPIESWDGIARATFLQDMANHQRTRDTATAHTRALLKRHYGPEFHPENDNMGNINVDSPATNHYHQQANASPLGTILAVILAALSAGMGGLLLADKLNPGPDQPTPAAPLAPLTRPVIEAEPGSRVEIGPPDKPPQAPEYFLEVVPPEAK